MAIPFSDILITISEGRDLTTDQANDALSQIIEGQVSSEQVAAFLFGMSCKGESVGELTEFVRVMRGALLPVRVDLDGAVDLCGTGGDLSGTFNISTAAMFVVAGAGVPVLKHGNRSVSSSCGSADVLEEFGAVVTLDRDGVEELFRETSMAFMFAPNFHPAMKHVMPARKSLGIRTFFNILGPLLNPAAVRLQVVGAFDRETAERMAGILSNLNTERAITLHAHDGLDEVSISSETDLYYLDSSGVRNETFRPESLGLERASLEELRGGDAAHNAEIIRSILRGEASAARRDIVLLNAAFGIYVSGQTESLEEALEQARESVSGGEAVKALNRFVEASRQISEEGSDG